MSEQAFRNNDDERWPFSVSPQGNANFAWVQHFIHHLGAQGMAGCDICTIIGGTRIKFPGITEG